MKKSVTYEAIINFWKCFSTDMWLMNVKKFCYLIIYDVMYIYLDQVAFFILLTMSIQNCSVFSSTYSLMMAFRTISNLYTFGSFYDTCSNVFWTYRQVITRIWEFPTNLMLRSLTYASSKLSWHACFKRCHAKTEITYNTHNQRVCS